MTTNDETSDFVGLWNASSRQVYAFILSLLANWADADEAFQETARVLWERFSEFRPGSDFTSWACRIAYLRAMELRRRKQRGPLAFSDAFVDTLEYDFVKHAEMFNARHAALIKCSEKLSARDRDLLQRRYKEGGTTANTAAEVNRSINAVYKALNRIHESLFHCIERALRQEGA
jgi:RNA polymerase sigma-70 factor, ECF subfamily